MARQGLGERQQGETGVEGVERMSSGVVPNLFGIRNQFHGRQFFRRHGVGIVSG